MNWLQLIVLTLVLPPLWGWLVHRIWQRWMTHPHCDEPLRFVPHSGSHAPGHSSVRPVDYQI